MAARSSAKPFHLASFLFFPLLIKRKWFTAFRPIPILKLHSPSLPVQVCLSANHPAIWHLLLYVKKQYFFTKISQFLDSTFQHVWDELQRGHWSSIWKTSQCFLSKWLCVFKSVTSPSIYWQTGKPNYWTPMSLSWSVNPWSCNIFQAHRAVFSAVGGSHQQPLFAKLNKWIMNLPFVSPKVKHFSVNRKTLTRSLNRECWP